MADIQKGELQDNLGNTIYPHTESDVVFCSDGQTVQEKLAKTESALGDANGKSGSLEVNNPNILATTEATHELAENMGGLKFGIDGDGNYGYYGADGSLIPFKSGSDIAIPIITLSGTFESQAYGYVLNQTDEYIEYEFVGAGTTGKGYTYTFTFDDEYVHRFSKFSVKRVTSLTNNKMQFTYGTQQTVDTTETTIDKNDFLDSQDLAIAITSTAASAICRGYVRFYY